VSKKLNQDRRDASAAKFKPLTCAFGSPWVGSKPVGGYHCAGCAKEGLRLQREFVKQVAAGELDIDGYKPNERKSKIDKELADLMEAFSDPDV